MLTAVSMASSVSLRVIIKAQIFSLRSATKGEGAPLAAADADTTAFRYTIECSQINNHPLF
jgi:hypothetical protein